MLLRNILYTYSRYSRIPHEFERCLDRKASDKQLAVYNCFCLGVALFKSSLSNQESTFPPNFQMKIGLIRVNLIRIIMQTTLKRVSVKSKYKQKENTPLTNSLRTDEFYSNIHFQLTI